MPDNERRHKKTDLVLSNGEYAFTQDTTTGSVKVLTGPTVLNITGQEYPVIYDPEEKRFRAQELDLAARKCAMAPQGCYVVLWNPPASGGQPNEASKEAPPELRMGQRINIPGPATFALWPQQVAKVIEGHHLRSNQYLLARVYDQQAAKANWKQAVLELSANPEGGEDIPGDGSISGLDLEELTVGKLFVVKGTEVSFFMPPTGVEVVPDENGDYVRDALTLERLQYCILVDETGDKDYQRGPKVVFPRPTQHFFRDAHSNIVFRPTELNPLQGIHVKVIAGYSEGERNYQEGEELFITGEETSIYFPRPEHSLITYDGSAKHFATAIPEGEARYVMNRLSGEIRTVKGPTMLLCDPRREVMVRRVLSESECGLYYPGNEEALAHNLELAELLSKKPSTRAAVSEGEVRRRQRKQGRKLNMGLADSSNVHSDRSGAVADEWQRARDYEGPRMMALDTKYSGALVVSIWNGYAVMVRNRRGERRVEFGPKNLVLDYDESLERLSFSRGLPKCTVETQDTVFLRLQGNRIRDLVVVETRDGVQLSLTLAGTVSFRGEDPLSYFAVPNYVQLVCEGIRRTVKRAFRELRFEELMADPAAQVQRALGIDEGGKAVVECGGVLEAVDVLRAKINHQGISEAFEAAQVAAITSQVELEKLQAELNVEAQREALVRKQAEAEAETHRFRHQLANEELNRELALTRARLDAEVEEAAKQLELQAAKEKVANEKCDQSLERRRRVGALECEQQKTQIELKSQALASETEATVARYRAAEGPMSAAISRLGDQEVLVKVAEATSAQRLFGGKDVASVFAKIFSGTPLAPMFDELNQSAGSSKDDNI